MLAVGDASNYAQLLDTIPRPPTTVHGGLRLAEGGGLSPDDAWLMTGGMLREGFVQSLAFQLLHEPGRFRASEVDLRVESLDSMLDLAWGVRSEDFLCE
jgi:hypothetical protein